jgi:predicted DNA-binding ribbon-helix-helix protein
VAPGALAKRSLTIAGHRTSVALEPEFWAALDAIAAARGLDLPALIAEIDGTRGDARLASALRLAALAHYREALPVTESD